LAMMTTCCFNRSPTVWFTPDLLTERQMRAL